MHQYATHSMVTSCHQVIPIRQLIIWNVRSTSVREEEGEEEERRAVAFFLLYSEADSSMFIELTPIEIHLQETLKCRSDYLEIFGYDASSEETHSGRHRNPIWKSYQTWCGDEPSSNHPLPHARYLITSNSVYISLQTGVSRKTRLFKIRYKSMTKSRPDGGERRFVISIPVVPSHVRALYNSEGIAYNTHEAGLGPRYSASVSSTPSASTTEFPSVANRTDFRSVNGTKTKSTIRKGKIRLEEKRSIRSRRFSEILIAIICGAIVLLLAVAIAVIVLIFVRRCVAVCLLSSWH